MAKKTVANPFQPKSLTTDQRMLIDQLVTVFGDKHTNVKFSDLKKACFDILHVAFPPAWITRNMKVRNQEKRGRYDLSALLKLPVVAFKEEVKKPSKKKVAKKVVPETTFDLPEKPIEVNPTPEIFSVVEIDEA